MSDTRSPFLAQPLLTQGDAARFLNIQETTLESWRTDARRRPLPYVKVGRLIRYRLEDLQAFIESGLQRSPKEGEDA